MNNLNFTTMENIFKENDFKSYGFKKFRTDNKRFYWFKDNNAKILAVAHLDSVCKPTHFEVFENFNSTIVRSPVLDDRLGVYIILDYLTSLKLNFDILLTTDEEIGNSTAKYFKTKKNYNWGFSFDRKGVDVVCYQYENDALCNLLINSDFEIGIGTNSDISFLEHLNCKFFNVGVGYQDYHSENAYANMEDTLVQVKKFIDFYNKNKNSILPH